MDSGIDYNIDTQSHEFDEDFETNHDMHREPSNMEDCLITIKVMIQKRFYEGMPLIFIIKNLYVPFGIPIDPKRFYKDGVSTRKLRRPIFCKVLYLVVRFFVSDFQHRFIMNDPNITMEEYIRLEEEKPRRQGRTFNWQTGRYEKMQYYEREDDGFMVLENEYPAIVINDISDAALSREPMVSPLDNNEIDFNISFDESHDEDYMVIFDKNLFSCKIISVDSLKMDYENVTDKVNIPSSLPPEPTFGCIDDLDFFKDFEKEFPAIVYNDLKSKSDPLNEPSVSSQHIDKFSLSEYDEKGQDILCFSNSSPLNVIFPNNLKMIKDNDNDINITEPSRNMAPLPHCDLRHLWLRYQTLKDRLSMVHAVDDGRALFTSYAWRRLFEEEDDLEAVHFGIGFALYGGDSRACVRGLLDPVRRLCHRIIACSISGRGQEKKKLTEAPQVPQPPQPAPQPQTMSQRIDRLEEEVHELRQSVVGLRGVVKSFITEQSRISTCMISCMTQLMDVNGGPCYKKIDDMVYSEKDHRFIMNDLNITMEEYIRLKEEKPQRQGRTFDWQTARYWKMKYYESKGNGFMVLETEYPAIVINDTSDAALSREPTISPIENNKIDFNISFDEYDDEDYMRQFILALGLHFEEEIAEPGFGAYWFGSERVIPNKGGLKDYWIKLSSDRDFLEPAPSYVHIRDPVRRLCHMMIACSISSRGHGRRRHAEGRKSEDRLSEGHFIGRLTAHFGLVGGQGLRGLSVVVSELPAAAPGALGAAEDALTTEEGAQAIPSPVQAP
uniref:Uncharacterized protein n=1 Tax=Tanacetum cinerariifolium TaxID=118510 RepID=A0A699H4R5_TANCI|nr:hypothetical protein [Tanacetum cinerariifolium]